MGLAGDGGGRRVADAVARAGPGKLQAAEDQQELQPAACSRHQAAHAHQRFGDREGFTHMRAHTQSKTHKEREKTGLELIYNLWKAQNCQVGCDGATTTRCLAVMFIGALL